MLLSAAGVVAKPEGCDVVVGATGGVGWTAGVLGWPCPAGVVAGAGVLAAVLRVLGVLGVLGTPPPPPAGPVLAGGPVLDGPTLEALEPDGPAVDASPVLDGQLTQVLTVAVETPPAGPVPEGPVAAGPVGVGVDSWTFPTVVETVGGGVEVAEDMLAVPVTPEVPALLGVVWGAPVPVPVASDGDEVAPGGTLVKVLQSVMVRVSTASGRREHERNLCGCRRPETHHRSELRCHDRQPVSCRWIHCLCGS